MNSVYFKFKDRQITKKNKSNKRLGMIITLYETGERYD
jgi:hypothetical protein